MPTLDPSVVYRITGASRDDAGQLAQVTGLRPSGVPFVLSRDELVALLGEGCRFAVAFDGGQSTVEVVLTATGRLGSMDEDGVPSEPLPDGDELVALVARDGDEAAAAAARQA
jgi:hypothetical protein